MNINQTFINSIGNKTVGYRAYMKQPNGDIGITAFYSLEHLKSEVIPEAESYGHKLLKIEKQP